MLDAAGYRCPGDDGCDSARTWVFAAFIYCWVFSTILLLIRIIGVDSKIPPFETIDMIWSFFSFLNYLTAGIVLACYLNYNNYDSSLRLASDIFGFVVAILYLIDGVLGMKKGGSVTPNK